MTRVCFVCLGNICRSPTAEGVMRHLADQNGVAVEAESAGTSAYHIGEPPDSRSRAAAAARGIRVTGAAAQFTRKDFARFDYVIALDRQNQRDLQALDPAQKVWLLRDFDAASPENADVPDPYYGGERGFEDVLDLCEAACEGLLQRIAEA
ncbi:MAG: low molecular weight protein-tyrosine-phosphatase [Myxococcota bacterium]